MLGRAELCRTGCRRPAMWAAGRSPAAAAAAATAAAAAAAAIRFAAKGALDFAASAQDSIRQYDSWPREWNLASALGRCGLAERQRVATHFHPILR